MTERITCPVFEHASCRPRGSPREAPNGQANGGQSAVVSSNHTLSYQQLEDAIELAVGNLDRLGVKPRERVALISSNTIEYIIALFALWRRGAIVCLLSARLPEKGISAALKTIACARTLAVDEIFQKASVASVKGVKGDSALFSIDEQLVKKGAVLLGGVNDPADIMFTSGSSGEPKAVAHSFGSHYYSAMAANEHIAVSPGDRWLLSLPLYHVGGLGILWRTFLAGGTVVVSDPSADLADSLRKFNVTHVSLVPTQLHRLLSDPKNFAVLQKMKTILIGGSAIPDVLIRKAIDARLPIHVSYGLTEMASQVAASKRLTKEDPLPGGEILSCARVRISNDHEILVKGRTLFQGYVNGNTIELPLDKEGWFYTGDLGCLNEDGTLTALGRRDNMFISGGENIQPEEIERHLCRIEGIAQAVVVPVKNEEFGERPVAFVEIKQGARLSRARILSSLRECLPSFKLPGQIYSWPATAHPGLKPDRTFFLRLIKDSSSLKAI